MSNKSGITGQTISLPSGGGAVKGIGETFSPDLFTGTGNLTIPIAIPPSRGGFQPQLSLTYSTGNGNGPFGLGWSVSVPEISRKTSHGIPRYSAGREVSDTFVVTGGDDLVQVAEPAQGVAHFRPRTEGIFANIEHIQDAASDFWRVQSKDGLESLYGVASAPGEDAAVIANPDKRSRIFSWKLTKTSDLFGNQIAYDYHRDQIEAGPRKWDQLYVHRIRYMNYAQNNETNFLCSVLFYYDEAERPDPFSSYRAGFEIRTRFRCTRIEVWTQADTNILTKTYKLIYLDERVQKGELSPTSLPPNGVSLLSQVLVTGHEEQESLPPLEFGYTPFEADNRRFQPLVAQKALPPNTIGDASLELVDLHGDGLPDIVQLVKGFAQVWRNTGKGTLAEPKRLDNVPINCALEDAGVQFADMNGNGRADLIVQQMEGHCPSNFQGEWIKLKPWANVPLFNLESDSIRMMDLDGDGITDALYTSNKFYLYFNDPTTEWSRSKTVDRTEELAEFPNLYFSDPRVKLGDMTGDGLQDMIFVQGSRVQYWPYWGYGNWGKRITTSLCDPGSMNDSNSAPNPVIFGTDFDPKRMIIGDVDGDSLDDIVYIHSTHIVIWINRGGEAWADPICFRHNQLLQQLDDVRLVDFMGSGIPGILWTALHAAPLRASYEFLDLTAGVKPYLLNEINNHTGAITRIHYAPSTKFYLADQEDPNTPDWQTPLPFPVQVVERVEVTDHFSQGTLTTQYRYHHGYWDGAEREFRGFGMVEQVDTETFDRAAENPATAHTTTDTAAPVTPASPPVLTKTWFHLGPIGDEFNIRRECDFSAEYWMGDPAIMARPDHSTELLNALPTQARADAFRTLRGSVLRSEVYALDGTDREARPYTVSESVYGVCEVVDSATGHQLICTKGELPTPATNQTKRIFFPQLLGQRTTQWERGDDPLSNFAFSDDYDQYGQSRQQVQIACPRGWRADAASNQYLATYSETVYAQRADRDYYMVNRVATSTAYEILQGEELPARTVAALHQAIRYGSANRAVIGQSFNYYDGDAFVGLPLGQLGNFGALVRTESLVLTEANLQEAHGVARPLYLDPTGTPDWGKEYPSAFGEDLPALAGYTFFAGEDVHERGYFVNTVRNGYDFQLNAADQPSYGLLLATLDPLGNKTTIDYDAYKLLPTLVTDPVGLTTQAEYDYRVLQPRLVTDANGNQQTFGFTPLGLPAWIAVMGKENEAVGDTQEMPGSRFEYDFLAYVERVQPISVVTTQHIHHVHEANVPEARRDETIKTVEYSDGFGRLLQTRTQGEELRFGDSSYGNDILPADQTAKSTAASIAATWNTDPTNPNVVVSGWQIYDNKGRVIEKYEPFFATGWAYGAPGNNQMGQKVTMFYDPRGQVIRTVNPDGSEQSVIYGIPNALNTPDDYLPTPWAAYTYDSNDNARRTHQASAGDYRHHWDTPANIIIDALGRTVESVVRNRAAAANKDEELPPVEQHRVRSTYDIRGNLLTVQDQLSRVAFTYVYDLANRTLRIDSMDAGVRRMVLDAAGNEVERRDSKGALLLQRYDKLHRPTQLWARDDAASDVTLREVLEYGDGLPEADAKAANLRGALYRHYDEAGHLTFERYDFKGNVLEKTRQVISPVEILRVFPTQGQSAIEWTIQLFRVDWSRDGATPEQVAITLLGATEYRTAATYDALNRVKQMTYPQDVDGERKQLHPEYNRAGALERVSLVDGAGKHSAYVQHIAYNAKGQRTLIAYGNGILTRYAYAAETFRLVRLRSERYTARDDHAGYSFNMPNQPLQDLAYRYDLVGNITHILDRTPGSGIHNNPDAATVMDDPALAALLTQGDALLRRFAYDPLYRLVAATGRECKDISQPRPWRDDPRCGFGSGNHGTANQDNAPHLTAFYREAYSYDAAGNMLTMRHSNNGNAWTRHFGMGGLTPAQWQAEWPKHLEDANAGPLPANRLTHVGDNDPATPPTHHYDDNGNMIAENTARHFEWDHSDHLKAFRTQAGSAEPSVHAHYLYDSGGQRVMKIVRKQGSSYESTVYIDGIYEHHRWYPNGAEAGENSWLHVMDDQQRIALVRVGPSQQDNGGPVIQFHLGDHLGSSNLVVDDAGAWVNREEHTPYGETCFGSFMHKRYRFTGKERDEESELYYHGARFYMTWLARWVTADPAILIDGVNLYRYVNNNPVLLSDPTGKYGEAGHYYTVYFVSLAAGFDRDTAFKNAVFAQMPDEVFQLDAIAQQKRAIAHKLLPSAFYDKKMQATAQRDLIQRALHSLTGEKSELERSRTRNALRQAEPGTLEFGFLSHRFGDTYAHSVIGNEGRVYPTGRGHASDFHAPDQIHERPNLYATYVRDLFEVYSKVASSKGLAPRITQEQLGQFITKVSTVKVYHTEYLLHGPVKWLDTKATQATQISLIRELSGGFMGEDSSSVEHMKAYAPEHIEVEGWNQYQQPVTESGTNIDLTRVNSAVHNVSKQVNHNLNVNIR